MNAGEFSAFTSTSKALYIFSGDKSREAFATRRHRSDSFSDGRDVKRELLQLQWESFCSRRWRLSVTDAVAADATESAVTNDDAASTTNNLQPNELYPYAYPINGLVESTSLKNIFGIKIDTNYSENELIVRGNGRTFLVSFTGRVGQSNRSIQSAVPFPPISLQRAADSGIYAQLSSYCNSEAVQSSLPGLMLMALHDTMLALYTKVNAAAPAADGSRLFAGLRALVGYSTRGKQQRRGSMKICRSFSDFENIVDTVKVAGKYSTPFLYKVDPGLPCLALYLAPRWVSYYEVLIRKLPSSSTVNSRSTDMDPVETRDVDCVAVGLATAAFDRHRRFPGWDKHSYGFHGDDGGIYHGKGRRLREYGPQFGAGSTVGVGLNHRDGTVFFTLDGVALGVAFENVDPSSELYPTVGIDMDKGEIEFNFGLTRPFAFDLIGYIRADEDKCAAATKSDASLFGALFAGKLLAMREGPHRARAT